MQINAVIFYKNLIGNAIKFTEAGRVEITARQIDNNVEITVTDTGIGISEKHMPYIFNESDRLMAVPREGLEVQD